MSSRSGPNVFTQSQFHIRSHSFSQIRRVLIMPHLRHRELEVELIESNCKQYWYYSHNCDDILRQELWVGNNYLIFAQRLFGLVRRRVCNSAHVLFGCQRANETKTNLYDCQVFVWYEIETLLQLSTLGIFSQLFWVKHRERERDRPIITRSPDLQ